MNPAPEKRDTGPGLFVVLEGIDGSGTTSQARHLVDHLVKQGIPAVLTREPSTGPVGAFLRSALENRLRDAADEPTRLDWGTMALLFAADRVDHVAREIEPALQQGKVVVSDRYDLSSLIYQSSTSEQGDAALPWLREINQKAIRPDLTVVLNVDAQTAARRRAERGGAPEMYEITSLQRVLARKYADAPRLLPRDEVAVVDGSTAFEEVAERVLELVTARCIDMRAR